MRVLLPLLLFGCPSEPYPIGTGLTVDADQDGVLEDDDCDDTNPNIHAGLSEVCDGLDNNCSGSVDENGVCEAEPIAVVQDALVDVLFVIDNSASMAAYQGTIAEGLPALVHQLERSQTIAHFGVLTTSVEAHSEPRLLEVDGRRWIGSDAPAPAIVQWTQAALQPGEDATGLERGMDVLSGFLTDPIDLQGFRRPDAHLAIVALSSEDDQSEVAIEQLWDTLASLDSATYHAIVPSQDAQPASCEEGVEALRHRALSNHTGGIVLSICEPDYQPFLSTVGQRAAYEGLRRRFTLEKPARPGTVVVAAKLPGDRDPRFYNDNEVSLVDAYTVEIRNPPPVGSEITITYDFDPEA